MPLTLEERERRAYADGRVEEAALLQLAIEAESDALDEMRHERDSAQQEAQDFDSENDRLRDDIEKAESKIEALEARIQEAGVDLV
jgi:peptidoglycan hydrolase CwlO-like protein